MKITLERNDNILLSIRNLTTVFNTDDNEVVAVENVSFDIRKGETVGIVGESGSGKSVTSLSVMHLLPRKISNIVSGEIWFNSPKYGWIDLAKTEEKLFRKIRGKEISMIFQEPLTSLNPVFRCGEQLTEAILLHSNFNKKVSREMVLELFRIVQLPNPERIFRAYPHELSGGQKQRVMIAMSMICNPSLLIADEPTTALDVTVQKSILELMKQLRNDIETSIIFITHDLGVVADIADRVIVMYKGKIVEHDHVWEIFSNPKHPYTKGLLACRPSLEMKLKKLPTIVDFMYVDENNEIVEKQDFDVMSGDFISLATEKIKLEERKSEIYKQNPLFEIHNLEVHYQTVNRIGQVKNVIRAVDNISFDVYKGETLGLVGESGCGKTTLGRTILGLQKATSGKISYNGQDITNLTSREWREFRKEIQIIFQDPYSSLNPRKTIGSAIIEPMKVHGIFKTYEECQVRALELLEKVGLNYNHFNRFPHEFSGGQRQRVCIARALAVNPNFIVCDESVSALDVSVQAQVLNLLNDLKNEFGFTYIFISHDLSVVKFMSDRMLVMNNGKIEEMGEAQEIYENPKTEYTKKLIEAIPQGRLEDVRRNMNKRPQFQKPVG